MLRHFSEDVRQTGQKGSQAQNECCQLLNIVPDTVSDLFSAPDIMYDLELQYRSSRYKISKFNNFDIVGLI